MNLDGGLGGIVSTEKNVNLLPLSSEKVTAVKHSNCIDYWIVTHFYDSFYAFLVTASGISPTPVVSKIGEAIEYQDSTNPNLYYYPCNARGTIKFSPNGKKLAVAHLSNLKSYPNNLLFSPEAYANNGYSYGTNGILALYDFNSATGELSNEVVLNNQATFYGVEFSTDSKLLYANEDYFNQNNLPISNYGYNDLDLSFEKGVVVQYNTEATNIPNSRFEIPTANFDFSFSTRGILGSRGTLQLALDGKIYHSTVNYRALHTISNPNGVGASCDFKMNSFPMNDYVAYGLPPFLTSYFDGTIVIDANLSVKDLCVGKSYTYSIETESSYSEIEWDFGNGDIISGIDAPNYTYNNAGNYTVKVTLKCGSTSYSFTKNITIHDLPTLSIANLTQCDDSSLDGITTFDLSLANSQIVTNPSDYTFSYFIDENDAINDANPLNNKFENTIAGTQTIVAKVVNKNGCINYIDINLYVNSDRYAVSDLYVCDGNQDGKGIYDLTENQQEIVDVFPASSYNLLYYSSEDDAINKTNEITNLTQFENTESPQTIYVKAESNSNCSGIITFDLLFYPNPQVDLGDDVLKCSGEQTELDAGSGFTRYLWSTGETDSKITVYDEGTYSVTVWDDNDCSVSDEVVFEYRPNPKIQKINIINNSIAEVIATGDAPFLYSLDGENWQESNVFKDLTRGTYAVYVKSSLGCVSLPSEFGILYIPNFISPEYTNNKNDFWNIIGLSAYPNSSVRIYDRYGKLIHEKIIDESDDYLNDTTPIWDGTYLGRAVPSTTYWYIIDITDGRTISGWLVVKNRN